MRQQPGGRARGVGGRSPGTPDEGDGSGQDGNGNPVMDGDTGDVTGRICSPSEASYVVGARVWVELSDGQILETTTDGDGFFTLRGVPVGTQTVRVQKGSSTPTSTC